MAKIYKTTPGKKHYHPGASYNDRIELVPGENTIPDACLDDPYIKDLIKRGEFVLPMQVTGVGIGPNRDELKTMIQEFDPAYNFRGLKTADLVNVLADFTAKKVAEDEKEKLGKTEETTKVPMGPGAEE